MPKDPLRAFRVDDVLWSAALTAARAEHLSVSHVLRSALKAYADTSAARNADEPTHAPPPDAGSFDLPLLDDWELVAKAQGILMERHRCDKRQAASFLRHLATVAGTDVQIMAGGIVAEALGAHAVGARLEGDADRSASAQGGGSAPRSPSTVLISPGGRRADGL